jgi:hypothetical protein
MPGDPGTEDGQVGLEPQEDQHDDQGSEESTATVESDILATPTCNTVVNWFDHAVPAWSVTGTVDCNMVRGTNSAAVRQLQRSMNTCYQKQLVLDGDFGGRTEAALIDVQRRSGTTPDGQYGPNTRKAMRHEGNSVPGPRGCGTVP